jgi:hypothetical protein
MSAEFTGFMQSSWKPLKYSTATNNVKSIMLAELLWFIFFHTILI